LTKDDWLCRTCYSEFYRDNRDYLQEMENKEEEATERSTKEEDKIEEEPVQKPKKEYYFRKIAYLLYLVAANVPDDAVNHRRLLVQYLCKNKLQLVQLPLALYYVRKQSGSAIEEEEFEKFIGIGRYENLFGFAFWESKHAHVEILHEKYEERMKKKKEKIETKKRELEIKNKDREDEKKEQLLKDEREKKKFWTPNAIQF